MNVGEQVSELFGEWAPFLGVASLTVVGLGLARHFLIVKQRSSDKRLRRQISMMALTLSGLLAMLLSLPLEKELHGQVLSLLGLVFTAVIALSSTTFVANIMGGLMVRAVRSFRPGDFIRIGDHFGRVTELGLFHTEIQSEDRDLLTLPNLFVITNPVKVVRASGTVVSVRLSLGYDAPRGEVETQLKQAAADAGLEGPYVHVVELGDFSVTYMVAGALGDIDRLLTTRSQLRCAILDRLHGADIEIVSPTFMNQRVLDPKRAVKPQASEPQGGASDGGGPADAQAGEPTAEAMAFDKGSKASVLESLRDEQAGILKQLAENPSEAERTALEERLTHLQELIDQGTEDLSER